MNAELTAMTVAIVGVVGTLVAPVLAQRSTARASRITAQMDRERRQEERDAIDRRTMFEERRTEYIALNTLARHCRNEYKKCARHYLETKLRSEEDLTAARKARLAFQDRYDAAQMILPDEVLALVSKVHRMLAEGNRLLREMTASGTPTPEKFIEFCDGPMLVGITALRHAMREDLGVGQSFVPSRQHIKYDLTETGGD